jgi:hypothetical protein
LAAIVKREGRGLESVKVVGHMNRSRHVFKALPGHRVVTHTEQVKVVYG